LHCHCVGFATAFIDAVSVISLTMRLANNAGNCTQLAGTFNPVEQLNPTSKYARTL
jgi:hypothetical protein